MPLNEVTLAAEILTAIQTEFAATGATLPPPSLVVWQAISKAIAEAVVQHIQSNAVTACPAGAGTVT